MNDYSLTDIATALGAARGNNDGLDGGNGILWLLLFIILGGGFGNNRGYGGGAGGAGGVGGDALYPWLNQAEQASAGTSALQQAIAALSQQLCGCCGDMQMAVSNGFANAETAANARQMANMQQGYGMQTAMMQGFNALQAQQAQCCCDARLENANQTSTLLADNAAKTQTIMDKLCQLELDGVKGQLAQAERENANLQNQLTAANFAASQQAQNAFITQGFANEVDALYNRLNNCPVPSMPVYGRTPIFTCNQQQPAGCGCGLN
jgi:hypothetical protein